MWDRHFGGTFTKEESVQDTKDTGHYDYKRLRIQNTKDDFSHLQKKRVLLEILRKIKSESFG